MAKGKLTINLGIDDKVRVYVTPSSGGPARNVLMSQLSLDLMQQYEKAPNTFQNMDIEYDENKNGPQRIRAVGSVWLDPATAPPKKELTPPQPQSETADPSGTTTQSQPSGQTVTPSPTKTQPQGNGQAGVQPPAPPPTAAAASTSAPTSTATTQTNAAPPQSASTPAVAQPANQFYNPYNFIPALPRKTENEELGDHAPIGHDRYHANKWTGRITVQMTTETPLLLPDPYRMKEDPTTGHKTFQTKRGLDDRPDISPKEIRGMLRSAYEAVTNSRMTIFQKHGNRLAYRMNAKDGLQLVPARIHSGQIELMMGETSGLPYPIGGGWTVPGSMYAAWLPHHAHPINYSSDAKEPRHGEEIQAWVQQYEKWIRDRHNNWNCAFSFWKVIEIARKHETLTPTGNPNGNYTTRTGEYRTNGTLRKVTNGYVCVTGRNMKNKHDERVFFSNIAPPPTPISLTPLHIERWQNLISNYQEEHKEEVGKGQQGPPALPSHCRWSRHIGNGTTRKLHTKEKELVDGTLCYARVEDNGGVWEVKDLFPVIIARELFDVSPEELLHKSLKPAPSREETSPADRVFGWANHDGHGAVKGSLRIDSVRCLTDPQAAIDEFEDGGVPLAILGQPKPQQARFYEASNPQGTPLAAGQRKQRCYRAGQGLRGRKVYPHHAGLPDGYWAAPTQDRTQQITASATGPRFQEYRRPYYYNAQKNREETRNDQNRSMQNWVKKGTVFTFTLHVTNLSGVELGALLWLLQLPAECFHKIGGGKPLGFGSVRLDIVSHALSSGRQMRGFYADLSAATSETTDVLGTGPTNCIAQFVKALGDAYGKSDALAIFSAFEKAMGGLNGRVHYPRVNWTQGSNPPPPNPAGEAFEWFKQNEQGQRQPLPALTSANPSLRY